MIQINSLDFTYPDAEFFLRIPALHVAQREKVAVIGPSGSGKNTLLNLIAGIVSQGLLQYLSACHPKLVWHSFGSWLRTIRPGVAPSEFVVAAALRNTFPDFLLAAPENEILAEFIRERQDFDTMRIFGHQAAA